VEERLPLKIIILRQLPDRSDDKWEHDYSCEGVEEGEAYVVYFLPGSFPYILSFILPDV